MRIGSRRYIRRLSDIAAVLPHPAICGVRVREARRHGETELRTRDAVADNGMPQPRIRRRAFLVGALTAAAAGPRIFDALMNCAPARQDTVVALVDAVIETADPRAAARRIRADYATALPSRQHATDEVIAALRGAGFGARTREDRRDLLRAWAGDDRMHHIADLAVALAASGIGPAGDDYRSVPVSL
jgi:hypothetical protein